MNDILREHLDLTAVGILDDVIIFSEDLALHTKHVRSILQILRENQLYAVAMAGRRGSSGVMRTAAPIR